ncbi:MAG: hypothetical protein IH855_09195 [Bacteroidetes bacterium]|nr:hypothetical protein [Bacteroidota bacterium]
MLRNLTSLVLMGLLIAPVATAQPDWEAEPTYGTTSLETGFTPDPAAIDLVAGGPDENSIEGCNGYINNAAPDVDLNFETDGSLPLKIYVRSSTDTVILVNLPGGEWVCNDDYDGTSAAVLLDDPMSGNYNIWVGTFSSDVEEPAATLYFTELPDVELHSGAEASQHSLSFKSGFEPDPASYDVSVGGTAYNPIDGCNGFVNADAPDVTIEFDTDGGLPLYIYAHPDEDEDLTMLVELPDGEFVCNDDADGLDPGLVIDEPEAGRYAVWVGSFRAYARTESRGQATLSLSEVDGPTADGGFDDFDDMVDMDYSGGENISLFSAPTYGSLHLDPGFLPDPETVSVDIGGGDAMSVNGPGCKGVINSAAPDVNVVYGEGGDLLSFYVESSADATLLVSLPNGDWLCNDDFDGTNPGIVISDPEEGLYNVWVGAFSEDGSGSGGTLYVSESEPAEG